MTFPVAVPASSYLEGMVCTPRERQILATSRDEANLQDNALRWFAKRDRSGDYIELPPRLLKEQIIGTRNVAILLRSRGPLLNVLTAKRGLILKSALSAGLSQYLKPIPAWIH
jgi:hypothetical protein